MSIFECALCSEFGANKPKRGSAPYLRFAQHFFTVDGLCPSEWARRMEAHFQEWKNDGRIGKAGALETLRSLRREWSRSRNHPDAVAKMRILARLHEIHAVYGQKDTA